MGKDARLKRDRRLSRKFQREIDREQAELSDLRDQVYGTMNAGRLDEPMPLAVQIALDTPITLPNNPA